MENDISRYCPNFNYIMECSKQKDDITKKVVNVYKSYVLNTSKKTRSEIRKIKDLDYIMYLYLDDYFFHDQLNRKFPYLEFMVSNNVITALVDEIFKTYNSYIMYLNKKLNNSKYIQGNVSYKY